MADTMQFDLVSPERSLASVPATAVQIPGALGDMTAMPNHSPVLTTLRPGLLSVSGENGTQDFLVTGGFAEVNPAGVTVLAERALVKSEVTQDDFDAILSDAADALSNATGAAHDAAAQTHAEISALGQQLGLNA